MSVVASMTMVVMNCWRESATASFVRVVRSTVNAGSWVEIMEGIVWRIRFLIADLVRNFGLVRVDKKEVEIAYLGRYSLLRFVKGLHVSRR